jgi:hypothetical protein
VLSHERLRRFESVERARLEREHIERQLVAYAQADAWFYWNYKTEGTDTWNFRSLVEMHPKLFANQ